MNESVPTSTPYVEEEATPLFTKKAEPAHTVYSGASATASSVYERVSKPTEPSKPADKVETPDTGDFGILAAVIFMASSAAGAAVVAKKKEN